MPYYRARKVDANQKHIIAALEAAGCHVTDLSSVGRGCPDLMVLPPNEMRPVLIEVKNKAGRGEKLTGPQKAFHAAYWGAIHRVTGVNGALEAMGLSVPPAD